MLFSHWYTSPTPSMQGAGNASRSVATFWLALAMWGLPLRLLLHHGLSCLQRYFTLGPINQPCLHGRLLTGRPASMQHGPSLDVIMWSTSSSLQMSR
jgi:hypothetical protein